jgi:hypothetical protein
MLGVAAGRTMRRLGHCGGGIQPVNGASGNGSDHSRCCSC